MTTANKVTILRILLIPFFIIEFLEYVNGGNELHRLLAMFTFAVAAISDGVDGYIARRYGQHSELGAILDPLADKLLLVSGIVMLSMKNDPYFDRVPVWLTVVIISRDAMLLIGLIVIHMTVGKTTVQPHFAGKLATVFQMTLISWILLQWHDSWLPLWIYGTAGFTALSGIHYLWDGIKQLSDSPTSSPTTKR